MCPAFPSARRARTLCRPSTRSPRRSPPLGVSPGPPFQLCSGATCGCPIEPTPSSSGRARGPDTRGPVQQRPRVHILQERARFVDRQRGRTWTVVSSPATCESAGCSGSEHESSQGASEGTRRARLRHWETVVRSATPGREGPDRGTQSLRRWNQRRGHRQHNHPELSEESIPVRSSVR